MSQVDGNRRLLNRTGAGVAGGLLLILFFALWTLTRNDLPKDNHDAILILINTVANAVLMVVGYFFGASVASARQGEIIATQATTIAAAQDKLPPAPGEPKPPVVPVALGEAVIVKAEDPKGQTGG